MRPNISINFPTPYLPIKEYCRLHNLALSTARDMVRDGRLPIRKKACANENVEINMVALTLQAIADCHIPVSLNA
ncbi:regulator [Xenorhabdus kozodoii]|uniref:DNA-binding protein n=1 Tax=Xenorhabdus kozodoii TaxID=351676 RepID=A0A2D0LEF7_9GAMM|nr:regulator [Xenorhabdus kozodoii]PHM73807.1 DNA-binding protein [Xenorhabdus kozodoii]